MLPKTQGAKGRGSGQPETQPQRARWCFLSSVHIPAPAPSLLFFQAQEGNTSGVSEEAERNDTAGRVPGASHTALVNRKLQVHAARTPWSLLGCFAACGSFRYTGQRVIRGCLQPTPHARKVWRQRGSWATTCPWEGACSWGCSRLRDVPSNYSSPLPPNSFMPSPTKQRFSGP